MRYSIISLLIAFCIPSFAQTLESQLIDINTKEKISDAFIFISNSSLNTVSDENGQFMLDRSSLPSSDIVITHISYETKYLSLAEINKPLDTIFLSPTQFELEEVVLQSKSSKKRKKWLRRFTNSLIGSSEHASKSKLLNPEVVLFQEKDGVLHTQTSDHLIFENEVLGYKIWFFLDNYSLEKDDDVMYSGKVFFEDFEDLKTEQLSNRNVVFERSSRKFFKDYISNTYDSLQYNVALATLESDGFFHYVGAMKRNILLSEAPEKGMFELKFSRFLRIENKAISGKQENFKNNLGFGSTNYASIALHKKHKDERDRSDYAVTYFGSRSNKIIVNKEGVIQNQRDIEEYGYWSELRLADRLPDDFEYVPLEQE